MNVVLTSQHINHQSVFGHTFVSFVIMTQQLRKGEINSQLFNVLSNLGGLWTNVSSTIQTMLFYLLNSLTSKLFNVKIETVGQGLKYLLEDTINKSGWI